MACKLLPVEWWAIGGALASSLLGVTAELTWYWPDLSSFLFAYSHYLGPLIPLLLALGIGRLVGWSATSNASLADVAFLARVALALSAVIVLHFNLKLWAPLLNPVTYDETYRAADMAMPEIVSFVDGLHELFAFRLPFMPNPYHDLFVVMFALSFLTHGLLGRQSLGRVVTATVFVLLVGGLSYSVAPAIGPFVFDSIGSGGMGAQQHMMHGFYRSFLETHGQAYEPALFVAMPGAMPSLHLANAMVFLLCAWRDGLWLKWLFAPLVIFFAVEAVGLKWHYLVDIPAGMILGWIGYRVAYWKVLKRQAHDKLVEFAI